MHLHLKNISVQDYKSVKIVKQQILWRLQEATKIDLEFSYSNPPQIQCPEKMCFAVNILKN